MCIGSNLFNLRKIAKTNGEQLRKCTQSPFVSEIVLLLLFFFFLQFNLVNFDSLDF
jgi:hypothetical protein